MRVTQMSNAKRNTRILFADKLDKVLIQAMLDVEMSLRERKNTNSKNDLGSHLFFLSQTPCRQALGMTKLP
jgi:hypothetical protein